MSLDRLVISSYWLSVVSISLSATIMLQTAMQDLSRLTCPQFWGRGGLRGVCDGGNSSRQLSSFCDVRKVQSANSSSSASAEQVQQQEDEESAD